MNRLLTNVMPSCKSPCPSLPFSYFRCALFVATIVAANLSSWELTAQTPDVAADAERAIVRSQEDMIQAQSLMKTAMQKYSQHDLREAYAQAKEAMTMAPSGVSANSTRSLLLADYTTIALAFAHELAENGDFTDNIAKKSGITDINGLPLSAESVSKSILAPSMNPGSKAAVKFLSDLEQPGIFNKTVTPAFAAKRQEVIKLLRQASDLAKTGRNELALKQYEAVLQIDSYNNAARKGMDEIHNSTLKYADEAYNETRSRMLWQVEKAWERPPRKSKQGRTTESVGRQQDIRGTDQITAKLNSIIIPKIDLSDSPISEAVEYLKQKSVEQDPSHKGVNIFLKLGSQAASLPPQALTSTNDAPSGVPAQSTAGSTEPHITLALSHVPIYVALDYISKLCNLKLKIDPYAVSIVPLSEPTDILITKEYQVPPTFIPPKALDGGASLPQAGSAGVGDPNKARVAQRQEAKEYLISQGVVFPDGASANYLPSGSKLVIRNTRDNIDQIDALVDAAMGVAPSQVDIQTKFVEINQNNIQELGFDWLLGPFSIGGSGVYGSGGGGANSLTGANYPFNTAGMNTVGSLRSGDRAISQNSIASLLAGQPGGTSLSPAPGVFSVAGVFTDPQFQMVIHALNQKKGVDLMAAPKVTTKSGVKATVKIVNEFIYPRQYDPPTFTQSSGAQGGTTVINPLTIPPPTVTPSFPRDFTKQDLGVVLEAKPTIGPDGYTIDLELNPKVTDFDGFINYGSPINGVGYRDGLFSVNGIVSVPALIPVSQTLTTNTINQPVFSVREVNTFVTVWDGQTVALGGLIREDVQKVQDKVPILGDIPMAGRLFRSDADQKIKKNLVIFVTPRILDAEGQPRRGDTEESEIVTPLGLPQEMPQPSMTSTAVRGK